MRTRPDASPDRRLLLLALAILLGGCVAPAATTAGDSGGATDETDRPVVVALIDSGINPYHEVFAATPWADAAPLAVEAGARTIHLTRMPEPTLNASLEADHQTWEGIRPRELVHFDGTRVLAMSFLGAGAAPVIRDTDGHGTATASLVARDAPHAVIVLLQADGAFCLPPKPCILSPTLAHALEWAAAQPWIDVISVSAGLPLNAPDPPQAHPMVETYLKASRQAAEAGKVVVTAAGNHGAPTLGSFFCGPPWIICVGGAGGAGTGESAWSGRGVDVSANFTEVMASHRSQVNMSRGHGTSFATPIVAAVVAETLWHAERAGAPKHAEAGDATRVEVVSELRKALNRSAIRPGATEWEPYLPNSSSASAFVRSTDAAHAPVLLPGQIGWGYIHAGLIPQVMANLGEPPEQGTPRADAQARHQQTREDYWSRM